MKRRKNRAFRDSFHYGPAYGIAAGLEKLLHGGAASAAPFVGGDLKENYQMGKIETFGYFKQITEKWRQKELKRLERRLNKKKKKRNNKN